MIFISPTMHATSTPPRKSIFPFELQGMKSLCTIFLHILPHFAYPAARRLFMSYRRRCWNCLLIGYLITPAQSPVVLTKYILALFNETSDFDTSMILLRQWLSTFLSFTNPSNTAIVLSQEAFSA